MKKFAIYFLVLFLIFSNLTANNFRKSPFEIINTETGLSQNAVISICQDKQGYIWFGTHDGLNRYDGFEFKLFKYNPENENSLSNNLINCLFLDGNYIFAGTGNGLCRINTINLNVEIFFPKNFKGKIWAVKSIVKDNNNLFWIGTDLGLYSFNNISKVFKKYPIIKRVKPSPEPIKKLVFDVNNNLLIGTSGLGLFKKDIKNNFQKINLLRKEIVYKEDYFVYDMCKTPDNYIYISTERSVYFINPENQILKPHKTLSKFVEKNPALKIVNFNGNLLLGVYKKGLIEFNTKENSIKDYNKLAPYSNFFTTNDIFSIFKDSSNVLWVGVDGTGVIKLTPKRLNFNNFLIDKNGLCVMAVCQDKNKNLYVGSFGNGLYKINLETETFEQYTDANKSKIKLSGNIVISLIIDSEENLWIGTLEKGITKYNLKTKKTKYYKYQHYNYNTIGSNSVTYMYEDKLKNIWIGTTDGISLYIRKKNIFKHFYSNELDKTTISTDFISYITERKNGDIIVATNGGGINILNKSGNVKKIIKHNKNDKKSLGYDYITYIYEDVDETLWIGTAGMGFDKLTKGSNVFKHFRENDGLSNNNVFVILEDNFNNLWMSTNKGISKFNKLKESFTNYDFSDGLQGNEFNGTSGIKLLDGKLSFGGLKGLNIFEPGSIKNNLTKPKTSISEIKLFNKEIDNKWKESKELQLNYNENTLSFEFNCLHYENPSKNSFKYKMEGLDKDFVFTSSKNRSVTYAGISPGNYTFKVYSRNGDNIWDNVGDNVKIKILPPFWGTLTFKIFSTIFFIIFSNLLYFGWKKIYISYSFWRSSHIIGKRYKVLEKIGSGGTGEVFKANDKSTGKIVALKILDERYLDAETKERFSVEQSVYEKIKHRNIVEVYSKGDHEGKLYYVMEYIKGITLSEFVDKINLNETQILKIFNAILDIVYEIHTQGVIHRDLKPDNIMICKKLLDDSFEKPSIAQETGEFLRDNIKILDFGLAKILGSKTLTQSAVFGGTLYYFPPEFLFGRKIRETAFDYYSLGVILYEMLTKSHLYDVSDTSELLASVVSGKIIPPIEKNKNISKNVSDFVMKLINKDPDNRLKDYQDIKTELNKLIN